jgi:sugar-specific transcriptional regulator TrmB
MSLSFLQNLGLTKNELELYELLLIAGEVPAQTLVKESKLKRPTVYKTLNSLTKKGLVKQREFLKKIHFQPSPPSELLNLIENHYQNLERARENLQSLMPSLASSYLLSVEKPIVRNYESIEGLKEIYLDILKEKKPGFSVMQIEDIEPELDEWLTNYFTKQRAKKKMPLKIIVAAGTTAKRFIKRDVDEFRFSKIVPAESFPFQHEVTIYGDKVAFIHYKKGGALIGIVIKHPFFAQTMKAWFDLAWLGAEKYN